MGRDAGMTDTHPGDWFVCRPHRLLFLKRRLLSGACGASSEERQET